jgi:hypothetical protein
MNFNKILESTKEYKGGNPNSLAAWMYIDTSMTNNRVSISDEFGDFEWDQSKSNDNVKGISKIGSGEGKRFSFYFGRYAYKDKYLYDADEFVTGKSTYSGTLACIDFKILKRYLGQDKVPSILGNEHSVLLLIDEHTSPKEIVSMTYTTKQEHIDVYAENKLKTLIALDEGVSLNELKQRTDAVFIAMKKKLIRDLTNNIIEGTKEFEKMINNG